MTRSALLLCFLAAACVSPSHVQDIADAVSGQVGANGTSVVPENDAIVLTVTEAVLAALAAAGLGFLVGPLRALLPFIVRAVLALVLKKKKEEPVVPKVQE